MVAPGSGGGPGPIGCDLSCVSINEAVSTNSTTFDQFGDSSDWFELYNSDTQAIDLVDWSITDDTNVPDKWVFPAGSLLGGNQYLVVWASDRDTVINGEIQKEGTITSSDLAGISSN